MKTTQEAAQGPVTSHHMQILQEDNSIVFQKMKKCADCGLLLLIGLISSQTIVHMFAVTIFNLTCYACSQALIVPITRHVQSTQLHTD